MMSNCYKGRTTLEPVFVFCFHLVVDHITSGITSKVPLTPAKHVIIICFENRKSIEESERLPFT